MSAYRLALTAALLLLTAPSAYSEVIESGPGGFTVRHTTTSAFSAARTWSAIVNVATWWHPDHTFSGSAGNMSLAASPQGCLCESLAGGGGVVHGTVVFVDPGRLLRIQGSLGPLQELGVTGVLSFALTSGPTTGGTSVEVTYRVGGYRSGGLAGWAAPVDEVIGLQVSRLSGQLGLSGFRPE